MALGICDPFKIVKPKLYKSTRKYHILCACVSCNIAPHIFCDDYYRGISIETYGSFSTIKNLKEQDMIAWINKLVHSYPGRDNNNTM